tara:strand:+ start:1133 stop:1312 length:180 start_codon:yes stop_codon:yes gene_type:complete
MATPDTTVEVVNTATDVTKAASILQHIKENNIAYLIGILISYQMGLLDQVVTYGTGVCA